MIEEEQELMKFRADPYDPPPRTIQDMMRDDLAREVRELGEQPPSSAQARIQELLAENARLRDRIAKTAGKSSRRLRAIRDLNKALTEANLRNKNHGQQS